MGPERRVEQNAVMQASDEFIFTRSRTNFFIRPRMHEAYFSWTWSYVYSEKSSKKKEKKNNTRIKAIFS